MVTLAVGIAASLAILLAVGVSYQIRRRRIDRVVLGAVADMSALLQAAPPPQRALLGAVADALAAQDDAVDHLERTVRALRPDTGDEAAARVRVKQALDELLELPEPPQLITDFIVEHAGSDRFRAAPTAYRARVVRDAIGRTFTTPHGTGDNGELSRLAAGGEIRTVADAAFTARCPEIATDVPLPARTAMDVIEDERARYLTEIGTAPRISTVDPAAIDRIARRLDRAVRRQLRLITMLHTQAEKIIRRLRARPGARGSRGRRLAGLVPASLRLSTVGVDLAGLTVAFDAAGEALTIVAERLDEHEPMQAVHLLASLRLPLPAGFPGRILTQESLAHVRPLADLGVAHRLAAVRWAAEAIGTLQRRRRSLADRLSARDRERFESAATPASAGDDRRGTPTP